MVENHSKNKKPPPTLQLIYMSYRLYPEQILPGDKYIISCLSKKKKLNTKPTMPAAFSSPDNKHDSVGIFFSIINHLDK